VQQQKFAKARALLERARLRSPKSELLWHKAVEVEQAAAQAAGEDSTLATHLINKALQECPASGILWSKAIEMEPKASKNAKSVDALKKCENDSDVILAVANLFWKENKIAKARKWVNRAVALNPKFGDSWGLALIFEICHGGMVEQRDIILKCVRADPTHGVRWAPIAKRVTNWRHKASVKLNTYIQEIYPEELKGKTLHSDIEALLRGEDPYAKPQTEEL